MLNDERLLFCKHGVTIDEETIIKIKEMARNIINKLDNKSFSYVVRRHTYRILISECIIMDTIPTRYVIIENKEYK